MKLCLFFRAVALVALVSSTVGGPLRATTIAADFVPPDALQRYSAITLSDAQGRVYEMFGEGIAAPDGAFWFDDGTILVFQTNDGRFGKLIVARYGNILYLRWVTWDRTGRIVSQNGRPLRVNPSYTVDLDSGQLAPPPGEADTQWSIGLENQKTFGFRNGARFAFYELDFDYNEVPVSILRTTPTARTSLSAAVAGEDATILYRTSEDRIGKMIVNPTTRGSGFRLYCRTYNLDGSLQVSGYAESYYRTTYTWVGPLRIPHRQIVLLETVDLDDGHLNESGQGEDLRGSGGGSLYWSISALSGARFAVYGNETPDLPYETIDTDFIASAALSTNQIDASLLRPGTMVLYETAQGRLGKLEIVDPGYDLLVKWRTFSTSTTTWSAGAELVIPGTASCDLDIGAGSVDYFSAHGDFRWAPINDTVRRLQPKNGARFFVYTPPKTWISQLEVHAVGTAFAAEDLLRGTELVARRVVPSGALVINTEGMIAARFVRGDVDGDGNLDAADSQRLLEYLDGIADAPLCMDAADVDDDGDVDQPDLLFLLSVLAGANIPIPAPSPECGEDPTADSLGCLESACGGW